MARRLHSACMRRPRRSPPWVTAYRTDQDALLLARAPRIVGDPAAVLGVTVCNAIGEPSTAWFRTSLAVPFLLLSVSGAIAASIRPFRGWGLVAGLAFFLLLIGAAAVTWRALPQDADLVPIYVCLLIMSSTLIFPWGTRPQAVVCATALAAVRLGDGRHRVTIPGDGRDDGGLAGPSDARGGEGRRVGTADDLRACLAAGAARLPGARPRPAHPPRRASCAPCSTTASGCWAPSWAWVPPSTTPTVRVFRFAALGGERVDTSWIGVEIPEEFSSVQTVVERGLAVLPEDAPNDPVVAMLRAQGALHALYVTLRQGGDQLGIARVRTRHRPGVRGRGARPRAGDRRPGQPRAAHDAPDPRPARREPAQVASSCRRCRTSCARRST